MPGDTELRFTDVLTGRYASLWPEGSGLETSGVETLTEQYLLLDAGDWLLLATSEIGLGDLRELRAISDLVYACDDLGNVTGQYPGVSMRLNDEPDDDSLVEVLIDRRQCGFDRNWMGFNARRWKWNARHFEEFVHGSLEDLYGAGVDDDILLLDTPDKQLNLVKALATAIWNAPFENYSRFLNGDRFRTGDETVLSIMDGHGGICSEKVQALRFLTDHYGLPSSVVLGGPHTDGPFPAERLREILDNFDFRFSKRHMRYWQHAALLYDIDGEPLLVDATNGNVPFVFARGAEAERLLSGESGLGEPVTVRMVADAETWHYHVAPEGLADDLFFALESWVDDVDLVQVFDNELGLFLSERYFVMPMPYWDWETYREGMAHYRSFCEKAGFGLECYMEWTLDQPLGQQFAAALPKAATCILSARDSLTERYRWWAGSEYQLALLLMERG